MVLNISKIFIFCMLIYMNYFQYVFFNISNINLVLGALSIFFLLIYMYKKETNIKIGFPFEINILCIFTFVVFFSGFIISKNQDNFMSQIMIWIQTLVLTINIVYICRIENNTKFIEKTFFILSFICAIHTIFKGEVYRNTIMTQRISLTSNYNPNTLGLIMIVGIFICILNLEMKKSKLHNIIYLISGAIYLYVILITGSRKSLIGAIMMIIIYLASLLKKDFTHSFSIKNVKNIATVIFIILIGITFINKNMENSTMMFRLIDLFTNSENNIRVDMYKEAIILFKTHPLFGIGFNNYRNLSSFNTYSHSTYAEVLACTGLIGSILYFSSIVIIIYKNIKLILYKKNSIGNYIILSMIITIMFLGVGIILIYDILYYCVFSLIISYINIELSNIKNIRRSEYEKNKNNV